MSRPLPESEILSIYRESVRPLYAYVSRRVGGDRGLAEDLVQETWMRALDDWPRKGTPTEPLAWLIRVAHNTLVSHFRRMRPEPIDASMVEVEDDAFTPGTPDAVAVVGWGIAQLRAADAEILEAFYFDGKPVREIAAEHAISERAVEGRLRRARAQLKKKLGRVLRRPEGGIEHAR